MADCRIQAAHSLASPHGRAEWNGAFFYRTYPEGEESIRAFLTDFGRKKADFSEILGTYHVRLEIDGEIIFFCDNAGVCRFFVDAAAGMACDRFLPLLEQHGDVSLDVQSAEEFLSLGYVYGSRTLDSRIVRSDPGRFYRSKDGKITSESKNLPDLADQNACLGLGQYMDRVCPALQGRKIACVITGGVDSRMILAHLVSRRIKFDLVVSGSESMADVRIACRIAEALNQPLHVIDGEIQTEVDFETAFTWADGQRDLAGRYRLTRMWQELQAQGYDVCFGGAAGELYKNSFLNQDFPIYFGKTDRNRFLRMKVLTGQIPNSLRGPSLPGHAESEWSSLFSCGGESRKSRACFRMGAQVLMDRYTGTNNLCGHLGGIAPLAEPRVQAEVYNVCPYRLEMHAFARRQVSRHAPTLAGISTDRGLTCRTGVLAILRDACQNYARLAGYGLRRLTGKSLKKEKAADSPLLQAKMQTALNACIRHGLFCSDTQLFQMKPSLQENMLTLGTLLDRFDI